MTFVIKVYVQILHLHHGLDIEDLLRPHWTILLGTTIIVTKLVCIFSTGGKSRSIVGWLVRSIIIGNRQGDPISALLFISLLERVIEATDRMQQDNYCSGLKCAYTVMKDVWFTRWCRSVSGKRKHLQTSVDK